MSKLEIMKSGNRGTCDGKLLIGLAALGCLLALPSSAQSSLPDGPGKPLVDKICGACHLTTVLTQNRATKERWEEVVENMVAKGADGTDAELGQIVEYLAKYLGPKPAKASAPQSKVNVNKATGEELAKTLDLSQENAGAIVQYRAKNGDFKNLDDLKSVPGIDAKKIDEKKDSIEF